MVYMTILKNGESFKGETDNDITDDARYANVYINKPITEEEIKKSDFKVKKY